MTEQSIPGPQAEPGDADQRRAAPPVICYELDGLPPVDMALYQQLRESSQIVSTFQAPPRDAIAIEVSAGSFFRIRCIEGTQVGDLNLWNPNDLNERFFSGKTRQLHASHLTTGDRLWSNLPGLRPMATITADTLQWYGWDADGGGVHDVIGTRCDPYTNNLLKSAQYHYCCHSNLTRALAAARDLPLAEAEKYVHDVLNVFMCTGFTRDTHQYFMKASPARPGDYIEFFAEMDLLVGLSACPGGNCGSSHSDDKTPCYPLEIEVLSPDERLLANWKPLPPNGYDRTHGVAADGAAPSGNAP